MFTGSPSSVPRNRQFLFLPLAAFPTCIIFYEISFLQIFEISKIRNLKIYFVEFDLNLNKNKSKIKSKSDLATLSKVIYTHPLQNHEIQYFYHGIQYFIKKWPLENFGYSGYHD